MIDSLKWAGIDAVIKIKKIPPSEVSAIGQTAQDTGGPKVNTYWYEVFK